MSNRFIDNETSLDAATLNRFEDDLKQYAKMPAYTAEYEENTTSIPYRAYRVSGVEWKDIPVGSLFSVKFNQSAQGTSGEKIGLRFGTSSPANAFYICYSTPDYPMTFADTQYVKVDNRRFLNTNRPYILKKSDASDALIIMDHFETAKFGSKLSIDGETLHLKNLDEISISNIALPGISGKLKIDSTTYTLRTGTAGAAGYITFVLE